MTSEALRNVDAPSQAPPAPLCGWCEKPLPPAPKGRPRTYCDLSCKSKAARRRIAVRAGQPAPAGPAGAPGAAVSLPPGVLAAAAEAEQPGPRRRVLELADALAGAAYYFAHTLDNGDPTHALTTLRTAVPRFTAQLLQAAQAAHDDAVDALSAPPAANLGGHLDGVPAHLGGVPAHLDGVPANLGGVPAHLDGLSVSKRRFENPAPIGGTTEAGR